MELLLVDQERIRHQFDYLCKLVFRGARCSYIKEILRRAEREIPFSEVPEMELNSLHTMDKYPVENTRYSVMGFTIEVRDDSLAAVINKLTPIKRDIVLLYYFLDMNGSDIARLMGRNPSTVNYHHRNAIVLLKKSMDAEGRS